jgi:hypothetical protein
MAVAIDRKKLEQLEEQVEKLRMELDEFLGALARAREALNGKSELESFLELEGIFGGRLNADDELLEECRLKFS